MKVTKIMMWPSRKVNLGNYNTVDLNAGIEITFDKPVKADSKKVKEAYKTARVICKEEIIEQFKPYIKAKKNKKEVNK